MINYSHKYINEESVNLESEERFLQPKNKTLDHSKQMNIHTYFSPQWA
jgi:hypothetical protein